MRVRFVPRFDSLNNVTWSDHTPLDSHDRIIIIVLSGPRWEILFQFSWFYYTSTCYNNNIAFGRYTLVLLQPAIIATLNHFRLNLDY